ncbi:MAG: hypothetical protein LUG16_08135 [Candidatus Gastranaerophilales bacterium]|nr:hypothetical protein [Candidatus Gastranaerophilales bacterium]
MNTLFCLNNISFSGNKKNKQPETVQNDEFEMVNKGKQLYNELSDYMHKDKIQQKLEKIPEKDVLYIEFPQITGKDENGYVCSNPSLMYCKNYYAQTKKQLKNRIFKTIDFDINKKFNKKELNQWIDDILKIAAQKDEKKKSKNG